MLHFLEVHWPLWVFGFFAAHFLFNWASERFNFHECEVAVLTISFLAKIVFGVLALAAAMVHAFGGVT